MWYVVDEACLVARYTCRPERLYLGHDFVQERELIVLYCWQNMLIFCIRTLNVLLLFHALSSPFRPLSSRLGGKLHITCLSRSILTPTPTCIPAYS